MIFKKLLFLIIFISLANTKSFAEDKNAYLKILKNSLSSDSAKYQANFELGWEYISSPSDSTYRYATKAFLLAKKLNSRYYQGKVFNLIGAYFQTKGIYIKAIENYQQSLVIGERIKNNEIILAALGNIGAIYLNTSKYSLALEYLFRSQAIIESDNPNLPNIYNNLSIAYIGLHDFKNALLYAQKALQLFEQQQNEPSKAMAYASIATANYNLGNQDDALLFFRKSLQLAKTHSDSYQESDAYSGMADVYVKKNKIDSAIFYSKLTLDLSEKTSNYSMSQHVCELLVGIYKKKKNFEKAFFYQEKLQFFKDKYIEDSEEQAIEQKMLEFSFSKRLHEDSIRNVFQLLEKDNRIRESQSQIKQDKLLKIGLTLIIFVTIGFIYFAYSRLKIISSKNELIEIRNLQTEEQKKIILQKNKEVIDSINYAKRIQDGLLTSDKLLSQVFKESFIFFKPKDIVSGDFYWTTEYENNFYLAVCDSTGHGVPGAFMSLLNIALLSEAIKEKKIKQPNLIFDEVRNRLIEIISADGHKDGFDGILIKVEKQIDNKLKLYYSAANNEPVLIRNGQLVKLNSDRMPVGKSDFLKSFSLFSIDILKGDQLYLYTDGYADQFGGEKQKKFKRKHLNDLLLKNSDFNMEKQWQGLNDSFYSWKKNEEQVDDICVFGIQF